MSNIIYYALDTETTGLDSKQHEVTQISLVRCSDRHQLDKYIKAEHPERASAQALQITIRTKADLFKGESRLAVVEFCEKFIEEDGQTPEHRCMIAHNASFDKRFVHALWQSVNKTFPAHLWLCTKEFTRSYTIKHGIANPKLNLRASLEIVNAKAKFGEHNALVDTQNAYILWKKLMDDGVDHLPHIKRSPHILE